MDSIRNVRRFKPDNRDITPKVFCVNVKTDLARVTTDTKETVLAIIMEIISFAHADDEKEAELLLDELIAHQKNPETINAHLFFEKYSNSEFGVDIAIHLYLPNDYKILYACTEGYEQSVMDNAKESENFIIAYQWNGKLFSIMAKSKTIKDKSTYHGKFTN